MVKENAAVSQKLLAALPSDPFEQLEVAQSITSMAVIAGVNKLEAESGRFRETLEEREKTIHSMQQRIHELEHSLEETSVRLSQALEHQEKVTDERNALARMVQKLRREISKLEMFKKNLLQSLQEDDDTASQSEDIESTSLPMYASSMHRTKGDDRGASSIPRPSDKGDTYRSYVSSTATSDLDDDRHNSILDAFPLASSASRLNIVNGHSSSSDSRSVRSPGQTPRVDGKEFFRESRNRLSYQQFSAFLSNIKELNAHRQSREETLAKAKQIFGPDNQDLYYAFDGLITRHVT